MDEDIFEIVRISTLKLSILIIIFILAFGTFTTFEYNVQSILVVLLLNALMLITISLLFLIVHMEEED